jgi:c-di-GMP-binding flagellar brake protein YcgR
MSPRKLRPEAGSSVTLLLEIGGVPVTQVSVASRVRDASMIVPRAEITLDLPVPSGAPVTVVFVHAGRVHLWPMQIEEVLPSSYFLTSVSEPGDGERREFVRAKLPLTVTIERDGAEPIEVVQLGDVSAAGFMLGVELPVEADSVVSLGIVAEGNHSLSGRARVVRADAEATAFEFVELTTAAENCLIDMVFQARAASLHARIGVKLN